MSTRPGIPGPKATPSRRYPLDAEFIQKSIKAARLEAICSPVSLNERVTVHLKKGFNTACWSFQPPHEIFVGEDLFEKPGVKLELTREQQAKYIANHYHHELGHALHTERDLKKVSARLTKEGIPFSLWNLFEDANMEQWYAQSSGFAFDWLDLETLTFTPRPESIFFGLIQAEGKVATVRSALEGWLPQTTEVPAEFLKLKSLYQEDPEKTKNELLTKFDRVVDYYKRTLLASNWIRQIPIMKEWMAEFGLPPESPSKGMADMGLAIKLAVEGTTDFKGQAEDLDMPSSKNPEKAKPPSKVDVALVQNGTLLGSADPVDMARAEKGATQFAKLFEAKVRNVVVQRPSKRISLKHYLGGKPFYKHKELKGVARKNLFIQVDCSGSMQGMHLDESKVLISALNLLAIKGLVTGHVVLSGVKERKALYQTFTFPLAQGTIDRIEARCSAEGLSFTLQENIDLARKADYVLVLTDGNICDQPMDKANFRKQGVFTWGLYAGETTEYLEQLTTHFDKAIIRKDAESLIDAILAQIK